jgi:hypothetical protein
LDHLFKAVGNNMQNKPKTDSGRRSTTKSGVFKRPVIEPEIRKEAPPPEHLPGASDTGATTGMMPVVTEGEDGTAERDDDTARGA